MVSEAGCRFEFGVVGVKRLAGLAVHDDRGVGRGKRSAGTHRQKASDNGRKYPCLEKRKAKAPQRRHLFPHQHKTRTLASATPVRRPPS